MNRDLAIGGPGNRALSDRVVPPNRTIGIHERHQGPRLDLPTLLRIVREWRWLVLGAAAFGLALGVVTTLLKTPLYKAWVTLEVNPPRVEITDEQQRERSSSGDDTWDFLQTQVGLLGSRSLAERVAQDLNLVSNPAVAGNGDATARLKTAASTVAGGLQVTAPEEGRLIRFNYTSADPALAAQIANGVADGFINSNLQRRFEASNYARRFLERQIGRTRNDLERSEKQLVSYAQSQGIINLGEAGDGKSGSSDGGSLQAESLSALNSALAEATAKRVAAEGAYRAALSSGPTTEVNTSTQALRQSRAALEAEYQDKRTLLKPDHPDMLSLRSRIDELDRQIARETARVSGGRSNSLAQEYRAALAAERALQGRVSGLKGSVLDLRGRSVRYNILQREVDTNRALYDALLQRYKEIGVAGGIGAAPISIVDRADVPGAPFTPNMPLNLMIGLGLGVLAGVGAAVGFEFLSDTVRTREDVRSKLQVACLGSVPKHGGRGAGGPLVDELRNPSSPVSEAYTAVTAALRFTTEEGVPRTLLVTSTRESEGKSSTALAVSQSFARQGRSVLLIDADLRKPSFQTGRDEQGLTGLLTNHDQLAEQVVPTQFENMWLLPCGPLPPNPADLLSTRRFGAILEEAAQQFDVVVVDGPPILGLADAPLLSASVHGVLFVVESGKTRTRAAVESLNRVEASGAHVLGAVLTKSTERDGGAGYYSYRYGQVEDRRPNKLVMIAHQPAGEEQSPR
ncbi:polysaccharide biosynthesis tyrosine autokinase [Sphingomonas sp. BN140010]|uniref:non-specific protein-tyrosine kinase n=1 Tax=Sphingomonas arvum TaxID=2992113 RepID=A0ABT3JDD4_9SPHN|nr:polysaccharide biosynthesis tyrosine autokinase [Sphingomonas sp. BN140010]MCW3797077.1 polysaccharide biosynthesis tyrosine autokinase [Sphingomonas sp. BN140010]